MDLDPFRNHILKTYFLLRVGMALIGILFPLVLWFIGLLIGIDLQGSISAYYHTPIGDVFVGSLFAVGSFLFLYRGFTREEDLVLDLAGIFAFGVALLPTSAITNLECVNFTAPLLHGASAILFFVAIAYVCIFRALDTLDELESEARRRLYKRLYRFLGAGMIFFPLLSALLLNLLDETQSIVFFVELVGIWTFSAYWIVKSVEIASSQLDNKPFGPPTARS